MRARKCYNTRGQTTVEAAYLIPVLLLLILLLLQPMILLYNRMVMENAAAEGCRLLVTATDQGAYTQEKYEAYLKRRLASIPPLDIFHIHHSGCTWKINMEGNENSTEVTIYIANRLKPLPLLGWGADILGMTDAHGNIVQEVQVTMPTQPSWVAESGGNKPKEWVHAYE